MKYFKFIIIASLLILISTIYQSCNLVQQVSNTLANIKRLQFKLENISSCKIAGIDVFNKSNINDFSLTDGLKLTSAFATKQLPAQFTVNLNAKNPNDGNGGSPSTVATITSIDYRLIIDEVPTISGDISSPVKIPASGESINIPINMELDLYKFFGNKGYDGVLNLVLALGGVNKNPAKVKLDIQPSVTTTLGRINYPSRITVVDKEWK
jgi:hypothetical protein